MNNINIISNIFSYACNKCNNCNTCYMTTTNICSSCKSIKTLCELCSNKDINSFKFKSCSYCKDDTCPNCYDNNFFDILLCDNCKGNLIFTTSMCCCVIVFTIIMIACIFIGIIVGFLFHHFIQNDICLVNTFDN